MNWTFKDLCYEWLSIKKTTAKQERGSHIYPLRPKKKLITLEWVDKSAWTPPPPLKKKKNVMGYFKAYLTATPSKKIYSIIPM